MYGQSEAEAGSRLLDEGLADTIVSRRVGAHGLVGVGAVGVAVWRNPGVARTDGNGRSRHKRSFPDNETL